MPKQTYTLTRLRALMDQDKARMDEGYKLYSKNAEALSKAAFLRSIIVLASLFIMTLVMVSSHSPEELQSRMIYVVPLIGGAVICTYLKPLKSIRALKHFHQDEESFLLATWGTDHHPYVSLQWDDSLKLYEVTIFAEGGTQHLGYVKDEDSFIEDFNSLREENPAS